MSSLKKKVVIDYRANVRSLEELKRLGFDIIKSMKIDSLYDAVCGHTDMQFHYLGDNKAVTAPECYEYYSKILPEMGIVRGKKHLKCEYPDDIPYNAASIGLYLICNKKYTEPEILKAYKNIINVRQGYSKCSICVVSKDAIITADKSIIKAVKDIDIDLLEIQEGYIKLKGLSHGFIGGATGLISKTQLAVNGNIKMHPDSDNIISFCKNHGVDVISLHEDIPEDIGSIIAL